MRTHHRVGIVAVGVILAAALAGPATAQEVGGLISGTVTAAATGAPLEVTVEVHSDAGYPIRFTTTAPDGTYLLDALIPGTYRVGFVDSAAHRYATVYYNGEAALAEADPVVVIAGEVTAGIDAAMEEVSAPGGGVAGTVTDAATAAPISGARVVASDTAGLTLGSATTDASGVYRIEPLAPGDVVVMFDAFDQGYETRWYNGKPTPATADVLTVAAGEELGGIDASLRLFPTGPRSVSGRVFDAVTGEPACITVEVFDLGGFQLGSTRPADDGTYRVDGLPAVDMKVEFTDNCGFIYATQWWNDRPDAASATVITFAESNEATGIDAAMRIPDDPGGWITGRVVDAETGEPACATVTAYTSDGVPLGSTRPDESGSYRLDRLGTGDVKVWFQDNCWFIYVDQWWNGRPDLTSADPIAVTEGIEVAGIDAALVLKDGAVRPTTTQPATTAPTVAPASTLPNTGPPDGPSSAIAIGLGLIGIGILALTAVPAGFRQREDESGE